MRKLGFCCGQKYVFLPQMLWCYSEQLCVINKDQTYYSYDNRYDVLVNGSVELTYKCMTFRYAIYDGYTVFTIMLPPRLLCSRVLMLPNNYRYVFCEKCFDEIPSNIVEISDELTEKPLQIPKEQFIKNKVNTNIILLFSTRLMNK